MRLRQKRVEAGLSIEQVTKFLGYKTKTMITMQELGQRAVRSKDLLKLARLYGCTIEELLAEDAEAPVA